MQKDEIWEDIIGYEGMYQVSNIGNIKSIRRMDSQGNWIRGRILKPQKCTNEYLMVSLCKNGIAKQKLIHILVATYHVPNPHNLPEVNHKKGIKIDNRASELEWSSHSNNIKHSYYVLNRKKSRAQLGRNGALHHGSKPVRCVETGVVYESLHIAAQAIGGNQSNIGKVCRGDASHCKGYKWEYA